MIRHKSKPRHAFPWTSADIRAEIVRRGSTPSRVAKAAGFSTHAGRAALRSTRYPGAEIALADFLGQPPAALWPDRYAPGSRTMRSPARQEAAARALIPGQAA